MADVLFVLMVVAFFGLMVLLVRFCDQIIGPDEIATAPESVAGATEPDAETDPAVATEVVS